MQPERLGTGYAPATINHAVAVLAAFYGHHAESGHSGGQPAQAGLRPRTPRRNRRRDFEPGEPVTAAGLARPAPGPVIGSAAYRGRRQATAFCSVPRSASSWRAQSCELAGLGHRPGPGEPLWWTRRRPLRPLSYTALRALLNRINEKIGTNVTAHDLRHTLCLRLVADPAITLSPKAAAEGRPGWSARKHGRHQAQPQVAP